jgi:hypothetical protein
MRFLGPVTQLGDELARPHELELHRTNPGDAVPGRVSRVTRAGFEVRADLAVEKQQILAHSDPHPGAGVRLGGGHRTVSEASTGRTHRDRDWNLLRIRRRRTRQDQLT